MSAFALGLTGLAIMFVLLLLLYWLLLLWLCCFGC